MNEVREDRSPIAAAMAWASRITSVSLEMVVPGLLGYWLDGRIGTTAVFTVGGFAIGMVLGIFHLVRLGKTSNRSIGDEEADGREDRQF